MEYEGPWAGRSTTSGPRGHAPAPPAAPPRVQDRRSNRPGRIGTQLGLSLAPSTAALGRARWKWPVERRYNPPLMGKEVHGTEDSGYYMQVTSAEIHLLLERGYLPGGQAMILQVYGELPPGTA